MLDPQILGALGALGGFDATVDFDHPAFRPQNPDYQIGTLAKTRSGAVVMVEKTAVHKECMEQGLPPGMVLAHGIPDYMHSMYCIVIRPADAGAFWGAGLRFLLSPMGDDLSDGDKSGIAAGKHTAEQAEELRGLILEHPVVPQVLSAEPVEPGNFLELAPIGTFFESKNGSLLQIAYRGDVRFHKRPGTEAVEHAATVGVVLRGGHGGKHLGGECAGEHIAIPHDLDNALQIYGDDRMHKLVTETMLPARETKVTFVRPEAN